MSATGAGAAAAAAAATTTGGECQYFPRIKGYQVEKRLGSGAYATVYKAHSKTNTTEAVAIKCIRKQGLNKASTENLLREIKILKQIKHDHVVQLKDFQWDENFIYLIMEYCAGGDLSAFIKSRRTIPEKFVRRFVQQIACALKHLHSKGIAHMDLKPQNILLTSINSPSLKLADFGFAQYMREDKTSQSLRGSPLYMAPEILKSKAYDSRVDLWSVGVIMHEVIFGYAPFVSSSFDELEQKIMDDTPIQVPNNVALSDSCRQLLIGLLQRNPTERLSFEQFFGHPFVDLEHMPSSYAYPKAIELIRKATLADERGDFLLAQHVYLQSIEYLLPAIQYEKEASVKQELREKAKRYLQRAEAISSLLKPPLPPPPSHRPVSNESELSRATVSRVTSGTAATNVAPASGSVIQQRRRQPSPAEPTTTTTTTKAAYLVQPTLSTRPTISGGVAGEILSVARDRADSLSERMAQASLSSLSGSPSLSTTLGNWKCDATSGARTVSPADVDIMTQSIAASAIASDTTPVASSRRDALLDLMMKATDDNAELRSALISCLNADEKLANPATSTTSTSTAVSYGDADLFAEYQSGISVLLSHLKMLPKDSEASKTLKVNIERWLSCAEELRDRQEAKLSCEQRLNAEKLLMLQARDSMNKEDDAESTATKQCIVS